MINRILVCGWRGFLYIAAVLKNESDEFFSQKMKNKSFLSRIEPRFIALNVDYDIINRWWKKRKSQWNAIYFWNNPHLQNKQQKG